MGMKLRAAAKTAMMFTVATLVPITLMFLFQLDAETLATIFTLALVIWMVWVVYSINLGQLESEEKIKEIQERRSTMISGMVDKQ